MLNNVNNSKLDQVVKQTLSNYEAPYNVTDWEKMDGLLDAAPKSNNFNWAHSRNIIIGLLALGGAYLIYHSVSSSKTIEKTTNSIPVEPVKNTAVTKPAPVAAPSVTKVTPAAKEIPATNNTLPSTTETGLKAAAKAPGIIEDQKNKVSEEEKKTVKKEEGIKPDKKKLVPVYGMGNEPIFGDMLDSSKGIIGKTKEKEKTKKAAVSQPNNAIGWSSFILQNNLDSLKKYHQQAQKDSLKK